ncbi:ABC transporter ATP-binding protein [[Eubacterium] cellulosolvens]
MSVLTQNLDMASNRPTIETSDLGKVFKTGVIKVHALKEINLSVNKGEFISVVGPSGCGKSTLLNMLGALDRPTKGKVVIDGVNITTLDDRGLALFRNLKMGFIFQTYNLINRTKAINNVELPAMIKGIPDKKRHQKALGLLKLVGILEMADRKPLEMSGGQQQRVAIARALINNPAIILADEPTGNLDSKTGKEIMRLLSRLNKDSSTTIVMVTHNLKLAKYADKIIHLKDGEVEKIVKK